MCVFRLPIGDELVLAPYWRLPKFTFGLHQSYLLAVACRRDDPDPQPEVLDRGNFDGDLPVFGIFWRVFVQTDQVCANGEFKFLTSLSVGKTGQEKAVRSTRKQGARRTGL